MKPSKILTQFSKLSLSQKRDLFKHLKSLLYSENRYLSIRQDILDKSKHTCSHCNSTQVIKFGTFSGKKRFRCKSCKKTFNELTGTSISCVKKKHLWEKFIKLLLEGKSIRSISTELKLNTHTIFDWRHKVLSSLETIFTKKFKGIVETDDILFKLDQKGRRKNLIRFERNKRGVSNQKISVMVTSDRYKTIDMKVVKKGRISKKDLERVFSSGRLNKHNVICSDKHPSISFFVRSIGLDHKKIHTSRGIYVVGGKYHVQTVNNLTSRFREWLKHNYKSVSTKYLQNYLYLFEMSLILKNKEVVDEFLKYSLKDNKTIERYRSVEDRYLKMVA